LSSSLAEESAVNDLLARSNALGADPTVTNYGGGNTSAKAVSIDPVTGEKVAVMWVKGSGGDLATLTAEGLATLVVDRVRRLKAIYRGQAHEDEMHDLLDLCTLGAGAAPSIDTAMHALLPKAHVDHLHPDSVISLACAADGEELTRHCFGNRVAWVPWRRPGFELAVQIEDLLAAKPDLIGVVMGGHGLTTWGDTSEECLQRSIDLIRRAKTFIDEHGSREPLGPVREGFEPLEPEERHRRAAALGPIIRGLASTDQLVVGRYNDDELVLDFLSREQTPRVAPLGTSCPDHFIRTKIRPLLLDLPSKAPLEDQIARLRQLHVEYRAEYAAYYERFVDADSPPMRGSDPAIVLVPGVGMFSFATDSLTARIAGEFYVNAINVIRGAEALSTYDPVPEAEKFGVEYWHLEERKLQRRPPPKPLASRIAFVTGGASGIGRAIARRLREEGAVVAIADLDLDPARELADELGGHDHAIAILADVSSDQDVRTALDATVTQFGGVDIVINNAGISISKPLLETELAEWNHQHDVMARGSFLVTKHAARIMLAQGTGGDVVYIVSKNGIAASPNNIAYGSAKASQAHQVRLLAAELGEHGIRVNGINPDGVVQGSGIFASGWGAQRAQTYGVPEEELSRFYANRTSLKREVLPEHVADAAFALLGGNLSRTTGLLVPVDGGLPSAFLR
jgi:rhamnulose-1-phosphate aldolase/alcohol dehydrogenase